MAIFASWCSAGPIQPRITAPETARAALDFINDKHGKRPVVGDTIEMTSATLTNIEGFQAKQPDLSRADLTDWVEKQ